MTRKRLILAGVGLAAGLLLGFLVPGHWVFVKAHQRHAMAGTDESYACPMFCVVLREMPEDRKCPVCGMTLTPISGKSVLNPDERRMVGLEVGRLKRRSLARSLRVVGEVDYDETRLSRITTRVDGWFEKVWADTTWMAVKKGDKLAAIYSPELYATQKEFLVARGELRESSRRRLRLFGISEEEIAELEKSKTVKQTLVLRAPRDGVVIQREVVEGASAKRGATIYVIADLAGVWVQAEVFERDLSWVKVGQAVRLEIEGDAGILVGKVAFIDPVIDRHTRTARVRVVVDNRERRLRVGQRVDLRFDIALGGEPLALPRSALLSTGRRKVVYRLFTEFNGERDYDVDPDDLPDAVFYELVEVRVGPLAMHEGEEYYPLLAGKLEAGMTVVTKGNLLLDSQAQLSGKPSLLFPEGSRGASEDPHAGH